MVHLINYQIYETLKSLKVLDIKLSKYHYRFKYEGLKDITVEDLLARHQRFG